MATKVYIYLKKASKYLHFLFGVVSYVYSIINVYTATRWNMIFCLVDYSPLKKVACALGAGHFLRLLSCVVTLWLA